MEPTPAFRGLECTDCGERFDADATRCPDCGAPLDPVYDVDTADGPGDLVPFRDPVTAAEGETPLVPAPDVADDLGVDEVSLKDESRNPTGSFRGMALAVTAADRDPVALAAAGDAAQSAAAYAGRAGRRSYAFVPSRAPTPVKAMVNVHGGEMRVVGGRYPDAVEALAADLDADHYPLGAFGSPYRHEGAKGIAHEIVAERDEVPDVVVVPVGTGELLVGIEKGFREAVDLGVVEGGPRLYAAQPAGCAPVVAAHERGGATAEPVAHPDTICGELEIPDPPGGRLALRALDRADGDGVAVADADLQESAVATTRATGVEVGLAGGVAAAAAWEADLPADATVVVVSPASGFKTADVLRSHLMGRGM